MQILQHSTSFPTHTVSHQAHLSMPNAKSSSNSSSLRVKHYCTSQITSSRCDAPLEMLAAVVECPAPYSNFIQRLSRRCRHCSASSYQYSTIQHVVSWLPCTRVETVFELYIGKGCAGSRTVPPFFLSFYDFQSISYINSIVPYKRTPI